MQQKPEHAFDRIDRNQLFIALEFYGMPGNIAEDYEDDIR
jgi:hypothetical protein